MKNDLKLLDRWIKEEPRRKLLLAWQLGHSSTNAIEQWFNRKKIPPKWQKAVLDVIGSRK